MFTEEVKGQWTSLKLTGEYDSQRIIYIAFWNTRPNALLSILGCKAVFRLGATYTLRWRGIESRQRAPEQPQGTPA